MTAKKENTNEEQKIFGKTEQNKSESGEQKPLDDIACDPAVESSAEAGDEQMREAESLGKRCVALEEEISALKDQLLRKQAEFENFRKRLVKDKEESVKYANQMLLLDITNTIDDFERAIRSAEESKDFTAFHQGVQLIEKQLVSTLEKQWGINRFEPVGEVFDPSKHLAIAMEESPDSEYTIVTDVYQKGYMFYDRVLRPAKVKVKKPVEKKPENGNEQG